MKNKTLRDVGLKVTVPRIKILQVLADAENGHISAEDIYRILMLAKEDIGIATIYRVLTQFETSGLVVRHNFDGGHSVFELATDSHHDHMVCVNTGKIIEFCDPEIERLQKKIAQKAGYELVDHSLILYVKPKRKIPPERSNL